MRPSKPSIFARNITGVRRQFPRAVLSIFGVVFEVSRHYVIYTPPSARPANASIFLEISRGSGGISSAQIANAVLTNWVCFFGVAGILLTRKYGRFVGSQFSQFCNERRITLHTGIPSHHRGLRATSRRNTYFKDITQQIAD